MIDRADRADPGDEIPPDNDMQIGLTSAQATHLRFATPLLEGMISRTKQSLGGLDLGCPDLRQLEMDWSGLMTLLKQTDPSKGLVLRRNLWRVARLCLRHFVEDIADTQKREELQNLNFFETAKRRTDIVGLMKKLGAQIEAELKDLPQGTRVTEDLPDGSRRKIRPPKPEGEKVAKATAKDPGKPRKAKKAKDV